MADISQFYPGGNANHAVPHATEAVEANQLDDQNVATAIEVWSGTQAQYDALVAAGTTDARTLYFTTD